jgi:DNA modification methylase
MSTSVSVHLRDDLGQGATPPGRLGLEFLIVNIFALWFSGGMLKTTAERPKRERQTEIVIFRISRTIEAQLCNYLDPASRLGSPGKIARKMMLEALAEHEKHRRLAALNVNKIDSHEVLEGEAEQVLSHLPAKSFNICVTSPPYWKKRDYGHPDQLGRERTPEQFIERLTRILMQVHRVLKDDSTLWLNLDDSYFHGQLQGIPWRLALELQRRGWHWRAEIVWTKTPKPEKATNRPTRAHEPVLLFSKRRSGYQFENLEPHDHPFALDCLKKAKEAGLKGRPAFNPFSKQERRRNGVRGISRAEMGSLMNPNGKNGRDVWSITPSRESGEHAAVMPGELAERCIRAGSRPGDIVLDPFCGFGTVGDCALKLGRRFLGIELLKRFADSSRQRLDMATRSGSKSEEDFDGPRRAVSGRLGTPN